MTINSLASLVYRCEQVVGQFWGLMVGELPDAAEESESFLCCYAG